MAYRLPQFILPARIWRWSAWHGVTPPTVPPSVSSLVNLVPGRRNFDFVVNLSSYLLLPIGTDIRFSESGAWGTIPAGDPDLVEVPSGSGRYYTVWDVERSGAGFANEHVVASMTKHSPWGGGSGPPPPMPMTFVASAAGMNYPVVSNLAQASIFSGVMMGDLIVVFGTCDGPAIVTVNDTLGTVYNSGGSILFNTTNQVFVWWGQVGATGTLIVNMNASIPVPMTLGVEVFRASAALWTMYSSVPTQGSGTTAVGTLTAPIVSALQLTYVVNPPSFAAGYTAGSSPFVPDVILVNVFASAYAPIAMGYMLNYPSPLTPTWSGPNSAPWAAYTLVFNP